MENEESQKQKKNKRAKHHKIPGGKNLKNDGLTNLPNTAEQSNKIEKKKLRGKSTGLKVGNCLGKGSFTRLVGVGFRLVDECVRVAFFQEII